MNLGIAGRRAVLCGSSRGLGRACAETLAEAGVHVVINGRDETRLHATAAELEERFGAIRVTAVVADVTTTRGRDALIAACPTRTSCSITTPVRRPGLSWSGSSGTGKRLCRRTSSRR